MNTLGLSLTAVLLSGQLAFGGPIPQTNHRVAPTKLARFAMGAYLAKEGTRLKVNVDKQLGGRVDVLLEDATGHVCYERTLYAADTKARLSLDLSELSDGNYVLKVTNGLEMIVRDIKLTTKQPVAATRSLMVLPKDR